MASTFSEIFETYRKNRLVVDGVHFKVPYWAVDKMRLEKFCRENDIPRPKVLAQWSDPNEIDLSGLPDSFVVKPANLNSSRGVMVLRRVSDGLFHDYHSDTEVTLSDVVATQREQWEWVKDHEPHRLRDFKVMAQERVSDIDGDDKPVTDFKFWMIGDSVEYIRANNGGDYDKIELCFYDGDFQNIDLNDTDRFVLNHKDAIAIEHKDVAPSCRAEMLRFAKTVAAKVDATFCRVDLYLTSSGIKLGEITPTPGSPFNGKYFKFTEEYDQYLGEKWIQVLRDAAARKKGLQSQKLPRGESGLSGSSVSSPSVRKTITLDALEEGGANAPRYAVADSGLLDMTQDKGAAQYRIDCGGKPLDALLVREESDTLIVSFHGALNRSRFTLPRYERLKTISRYGTNALYVSDPTLWLDETLQLGWYTGWDEVDVQREIASIAVHAAKACGASKIIFSGSSGGGFAALQVSALVPESVAVVFNPSVYIHGYLVNGEQGQHGTERKYLEVVRPEAIDGSLKDYDFDEDWTIGVGDSVSVLERYSKRLENYVLFCQTPTDWHYGQHYLPFLGACAKGENLGNVRVFEYGDRVGHFPPHPHEFDAALREAMAWSDRLLIERKRRA